MTLYHQLQAHWLAHARLWNRCPECDAKVDKEKRGASLYCSVWCVEAAWKREMR